MKNLKTLLKDRRGSVQIDMAGSLLIWGLFMALTFSVFAAFILEFNITAAASDVKRMIECDGRYDSAEQQKITDFLASENIHALVTVSPAPSGGAYNLGDLFTVTLTATTSIGAGSSMSVPLPLIGRASGSCEVYNK